MEKSSQNKVKVSVCISVHNTAKYLPRCLDSVCAQTLQSLEIVLVNNGSTDNSEDIMYEYEKKHPERKFVIISQEDRSLAGGRQSGINKATGDYITFLDADDLVLPEAYETLLKCAEKEHVDIVEMETKRDGKVLGSNYSGYHNTHDILRLFFVNGGLQSMLWLRLYKRILFNKPVFPQLYTNNEDMFAMPCLLHTARSIYFLKEPLHIYSNDNENGIMLSETNNPELAERRFSSRRKALLSIPFFCQFVGDDVYMEEYYYEHSQYKATYIFKFLIKKFVGKTISNKEIAVIDTMGFSSKKELRSYLHNWLPWGGIYFIYRFFGLRIAYLLNNIANCMIYLKKITIN